MFLSKFFSGTLRPIKLKTICYISCKSKYLSDQESERLIEETKCKNSTCFITGIIVHVGDHYFQILEGEEKKINTLYKKIVADNRHYEIVELFNKPIKRKYFETYQSSFQTTFDSEEIKAINVYLKGNIDYPFTKKIESILDLLALSAAYE